MDDFIVNIEEGKYDLKPSEHTNSNALNKAIVSMKKRYSNPVMRVLDRLHKISKAKDHAQHHGKDHSDLDKKAERIGHHMAKLKKSPDKDFADIGDTYHKKANRIAARKEEAEVVGNDIQELGGTVILERAGQEKRIENNPALIAKYKKEGWNVVGRDLKEVSIKKTSSGQYYIAHKEQVYHHEDKKWMHESDADSFKGIAHVNKATIEKHLDHAKESLKEGCDMKNTIKQATSANHGNRVKKNKMAAKQEVLLKVLEALGEGVKDMTLADLSGLLHEEMVRRGRPPKAKESKEDKPDDKEHIVMGLRKSVSLRGQYDVEFADGSKHKIQAHHAHAALKAHDELKKPSEKLAFARKLHMSHESFHDAIKGLLPKKS